MHSGQARDKRKDAGEGAARHRGPPVSGPATPTNPAWARLAMSTGAAPAVEPADGAAEGEARALAARALAGPAVADPPADPPAAGVRRAPARGAFLPPVRPAASRLLLATPGRPLPEGLAADLGGRFGRPLGDVRIHDDPSADFAAAALRARAFTVGTDVAFRDGQYSPSTEGGRRLIAHEVAHVLQQTGTARGAAPVTAGRIQRDPDPAELDPDEPVPPEPVRAADEEEDGVGPLVAPAPAAGMRATSSEPDLFIFPGTATREEIAEQLFDDPSLTHEFDFVQTTATTVADGVPERAVRVRSPRRLSSTSLAWLQRMCEVALEADVRWTIAKLKEAVIDDADEWALAERCLRWTQRSEVPDESGTSYFDRYLDELAGVTLVAPGLFSDIERNALDWLLRETEGKSEQVRKAIALRSRRWSTGYTVLDARPELARGTVVGRFYWSSGSGLQLLVAGTIANEGTRERAEEAARSSSFTGARVVVPGDDGRFYAYGVTHPTLDPLVLSPFLDPGGHFYWYHPGTTYIAPGQFDAEFAEGGPAERSQRRDLLTRALGSATSADPLPLVGLDYGVLATATLDERIQIFRTVLDGGAAGSIVGRELLTRTMVTTPAEEFMAFERRLSTEDLLGKLLSGDQGMLAEFGQAFTAKTLASVPIGIDALSSMETFEVGEDASGTYHWAFGVPTTEASAVVAGDAWSPEAGPRVGAEPGLPGEAGGAITRTAIRFDFASHEPRAVGSPPAQGPVTRAFLPTELIRVEILGAERRTRIVTALEAAAITATPAAQMLRIQAVRSISANLWARAGVGLAGAFGPALARGIVVGGWRAGLRAVLETGATEAGRRALRGFVGEALLLGSMQAVEEHRDELEQTEEGRVFLATYEVAMGALMARDVYRLLSSGLLTSVARHGWAAIRFLGTAGRDGLRAVLRDIDALNLAWRRLGEARKLVASTTPEGFRTLRPASDETFQHFFFSARAELASQRVVAGMGRAGASTANAERVFERLRALGAGSEDLARAHGAIARRAEALAPAEVDAFLTAAERALAARPAAAEELSFFLRAAARAPDPVAFLADVEWLALRSGVGKEALAELGRKALSGQLDLAWLRTTRLTDRDLSFLGRDSNTPWQAFRSAALDPTNVSKQKWASASLRGAAGEVVAQRMARGLFPGQRISGRQVEMGSSKIDFELTSTDGLGTRRGLEIKGWTPETWREALNAYGKRTLNTALSADEVKAVKKLDHLLKQLRDAEAHSGNKPYLAVTDGMSGPTARKFDTFIAAEAPGTRVVKMDEGTIKDIARQLGAAMGL